MSGETDVVEGRIKEAPVMLVRAIIGIVLGGLAGFGLYRYVGCANGTCLIASSPWGSIVYCMILGFVLSQIRRHGPVPDCRPADHDLGGVDSDCGK